MLSTIPAEHHVNKQKIVKQTIDPLLWKETFYIYHKKQGVKQANVIRLITPILKPDSLCGKKGAI